MATSSGETEAQRGAVASWLSPRPLPEAQRNFPEGWFCFRRSLGEVGAREGPRGLGGVRPRPCAPSGAALPSLGLHLPSFSGPLRDVPSLGFHSTVRGEGIRDIPKGCTEKPQALVVEGPPGALWP